MKIFKSFSVIAILALVVGSMFGAIKGISVLCFFLGVGELINAKEYYDNGNTHTALLYLMIGTGVCVCGILSFTNII